MLKALRGAHTAISVAVGLAIPLLVYVLNGTVEHWTFVLGAVIGFSNWYFFPFFYPERTKAPRPAQRHLLARLPGTLQSWMGCGPLPPAYCARCPRSPE